MDMRREDCREHWDTPATLISHTWRGSMFKVRKAEWEDGKKRRKG